MAKAPVEEFPQVQAKFEPGPYQTIQARPEAFGGLVGAAEQKAGAEAEQAGGNLIQTAILRQQLFNEVTSDGAFKQFQEGVYLDSLTEPPRAGASKVHLRYGAAASDELVKEAMHKAGNALAETRALAWGVHDPEGALKWAKDNVDPAQYLRLERELESGI